MDAYIFQFTAKQIRAIDPEVLGFLVASGHCCNELTALMPYVAFEYSLENANDVEAAFILARRYTVARILISKIVEYDELCKDNFGKLRDESPALIKEWSRDYELIGKKIRSAKWARILRNKTSFHYDHKHPIESLDKLDDGHPLRLIAGPIKGLTLFDFSEEIVSRPIFEMAGQGDIGRGMDVANKFVLEFIRAIPIFHAKATILAFRTFGLITERIKSELREKYCGSPGEIFMPLSISSTYIRSRLKRAPAKRKRT